MLKIANHDLSKVLGRANECMRRLIEAGLSYEDLQKPITDPEMRERLVRYWKNPTTALLRNSIVVNRNIGSVALMKWVREFLRQDQQFVIKWQDQKNFAMKEIDLNGIQLESGLSHIGDWADIKQRIENLKEAGRVFPDAYVFKTLWENQSLIPKEWKEKLQGFDTGRILFVGTTFGEEQSEHFSVLRLSHCTDTWSAWKDNSFSCDKDISYLIATLPDFSS